MVGACYGFEEAEGGDDSRHGSAGTPAPSLPVAVLTACTLRHLGRHLSARPPARPPAATKPRVRFPASRSSRRVTSPVGSPARPTPPQRGHGRRSLSHSEAPPPWPPLTSAPPPSPESADLAISTVSCPHTSTNHCCSCVHNSPSGLRYVSVKPSSTHPASIESICEPRHPKISGKTGNERKRTAPFQAGKGFGFR
jgi:hypothetical protein